MAGIERFGAVAVLAGLIVAACSSGGAPKASGSSSTLAPTSRSTATTVAVSPASFLLGPADLAGYSATAAPAPTPLPCGFHFGDTSTASTRAAADFATAGSQQTAEETVAVYPSVAAATAMAASFRTAQASCSQFDDTDGPTRTYQVRALAAPTVPADDMVAVSLASPAHFYDLILLRSGAHLAWLALSQVGNPVDPAVLASVTTAAARRLAT
jgi:hypothetical protein